jgi:hypothetical protein
MDSVLAPFRPHILKRVSDKVVVCIRLLLTKMRICDVNIILDELEIPTHRRYIFPCDIRNPIYIKQCKIPAKLILKHLTSHEEDFYDDLSLELAMQGYCSMVVKRAAKCAKKSLRSPVKFSFSKWAATDKINVRKVQKLMKYHDISKAIECHEFMKLVYNQPGFELLKLCPAWQDRTLFVEHCRLKYTESDIRPFGWITSDLVEAVWELNYRK